MGAISLVDLRLSERIVAEYRAMPGLRLTVRQAARLWAVDVDCCRATLDALVAAGRLARGAKGDYYNVSSADKHHVPAAYVARKGPAA